MGNILETSDPEASKMEDSQVKWGSFPSLLLAFLSPFHAKWIKGLFVEIFLLYIISVKWGISNWRMIEVNSIQDKETKILSLSTVSVYQQLIKDKIGP